MDTQSSRASTERPGNVDHAELRPPFFDAARSRTCLSVGRLTVSNCITLIHTKKNAALNRRRFTFRLSLSADSSIPCSFSLSARSLYVHPRSFIPRTMYLCATSSHPAHNSDCESGLTACLRAASIVLPLNYLVGILPNRSYTTEMVQFDHLIPTHISQFSFGQPGLGLKDE